MHPGDGACPLMSPVHSLGIANVCDTASHMHVRVMSMIWCCLAAHFLRQCLSLEFSDAWFLHCYNGKTCRTVDSSVCSW